MESNRTKKGCCHEEFHRSNFLLDFHDPDAFVSSQWVRPSLVFVIYRIIVALYFIIWVVVHWVYTLPIEGLSLLLFFTEWSFDILTISFILRAGLSCYGYNKQTHHPEQPAFQQMTWILKFSWVLYNIPSCIAPIVTTMYWVFLFDASEFTNATEWALNIQRHALQSVFVVFDVFFSATPIRIYHVFHPWIFLTIYILFITIYQLVPPSRPPVYSLMDWRNSPGTAAGFSVVLIFVATTVSWLFLYGLHKLRIVIFENACPTGQREPKKEVQSQNGRIPYYDNAGMNRGSSSHQVTNQDMKVNGSYNQGRNMERISHYDNVGYNRAPAMPNHNQVTSQHGVHAGPVTKIFVTS